MPQSRKSQLSFAILLCAALLLSLAVFLRTPAPETQLLWEAGAPGALGSQEGDKPELKIYLPPSYNASRAGIIICPGGAYHKLMSGYEGEDIAQVLNNAGIAAFVLKYRLHPRYHFPASLEDALRAIRLVRHQAGMFRLDKNKIGIMGFSAGGHLASNAATLFNRATLNPSDPVDTESSRPDFAVLGYPLITMLPPLTHDFNNLLGAQQTEEMQRMASSELHVTRQTPPVFMFHTDEDRAVPPENSLRFYMALHAQGVPAELHIYEKGRHGAGLGNGKNGAHDVPSLTTWPNLLINWMTARGLLSGHTNTGF